MMKKNKKSIIILLVTIVILIIVIVLLKPYYKIVDRTDKLKSFRYLEGEKATGWLRVQGTDIDMAILNNKDFPNLSNPTYDIGWSSSKSDLNYDRILIYSHNIKNVSSHPLIKNKNHIRFEQLMSFIYYDFAKENEYLEYTVKDKNELYKIYAVYLIETDNLIEDNGNMKKSVKKEYIREAIDNSYFKYDIDVSSTDKLITLATCTRFYGNSDYSFVVEARKIRNNELNKKYGVTKKKKYGKIEEIIEGDVE